MGPLAHFQTRLVYYGGLFDGEGSVYLSFGQRKERSMHLVVSVAMTDTIGLQLLLADFGGGLSTCGRMPKPAHHKQPYKWCVKSRKAATFLRAIRPYTLNKAAQIELGLAFQDRVQQVEQRGHGKLSLKEFQWRKELMLRLRALKRVPVYGMASGIPANSGNPAMGTAELNEPVRSKSVETKRRTGSFGFPEDIVHSNRN